MKIGIVAIAFLVTVIGCSSGTEQYVQVYEPAEQAPDAAPVEQCSEHAKSAWTDGAWQCSLCECENQKCSNVSATETHSGTCKTDGWCSVECPSPLFLEWKEQGASGWESPYASP